jgi:WD40 repeat protein
VDDPAPRGSRAPGDGVRREFVVAPKTPLYSVAVSPDGRQSVVGSQDADAWMWDLTTSALIRLLRGHRNTVSGSPTRRTGHRGQASFDHTVRIWVTADGTLRHLLTGHEDVVHAVAVSADGGRLASCGRDGTVRLWDARTGSQRHSLTGHDGWVLSVAFAPSGRTLVSGGRDRTLRFWDIRTGEPLATLPAGPGWVNRVVFAPSGRTVAAGVNDGTVRVWDLSDSPELR